MKKVSMAMFVCLLVTTNVFAGVSVPKDITPLTITIDQGVKELTLGETHKEAGQFLKFVRTIEKNISKFSGSSELDFSDTIVLLVETYEQRQKDADSLSQAKCSMSPKLVTEECANIVLRSIRDQISLTALHLVMAVHYDPLLTDKYGKLITVSP